MDGFENKNGRIFGYKYIIVFIFRKFSSSGEKNSKGVRVHLLASDQESERRVVEREESIDGSVLGMEEETDNPELYLEMGNLLLGKEDRMVNRRRTL